MVQLVGVLGFSVELVPAGAVLVGLGDWEAVVVVARPRGAI